jgi:hypothetical protein
MTRATRAFTVAALILLMLGATARPASADATAFLGVTPTPDSHLVRGFAGGVSLLIIGFEFEYANTKEGSLDRLPGLKTYSANVLLQTPTDISGVQLYATGGVGLYTESLLDLQETSGAVNLGGGAKIKLAGPLRLRADYRVFHLEGSPQYATYQRFYLGANLRF